MFLLALLKEQPVPQKEQLKKSAKTVEGLKDLYDFSSLLWFEVECRNQEGLTTCLIMVETKKREGKFLFNCLLLWSFP